MIYRLRNDTIKWLARLCVGVSTLAFAPQAKPQQAPLEYQVKAAFLLNFAKFIDWPPPPPGQATAPLNICLVGGDPFGAALDRMLQGETVNDRKLVVQRVRGQSLSSCNVVYVSRSEKDTAGLLANIGRGVLTVGESKTFLREGGIIAFVIENRRVRFDVNQSAARSADLKVSSRLLSVARSVED